jgi:hypothetical protein
VIGRFARDESGVALGLAVIMVVLITCTKWHIPSLRFTATVREETEVEVALI